MKISAIHLCYVLLSAYCLAGCLIEHFALFYAWSFATNATDLARMQRHSGTRIAWLYVLPKAILTAAVLYLAVNATIYPVAGVWWSVAFHTLSWTSAGLIQVPAQLKLRASAGRDREALQRLLDTTWVRSAAMVGHCVVSSREG